MAQVGPYPPPYGGVSVHIKRLHRRLTALGIPSRVYCQPSVGAGREEHVVPAALKFSWHAWIPERAWRCHGSIVHFHDGWVWAPAALAMLLLGRKVVMTFHGQRAGTTMWRGASGFERWASRRLIAHPRAWWVAVSREVRRQLVELGVTEERIILAPAYIPPRRDADPASLPGYLRDFLRAHSPVLSTYAWRLCLDERGTDVYGFDHCIELVRALRDEFPGIGLAVSLPEVANPEYFRELQARVADNQLAGQVLFVTEPLDDVQLLWQESDVYVRATNTDGDAVVVREAMGLGVPVVASDASVRPAGTVLFPTRDLEAMVRAVREVLTHRDAHVRALQGVTIEDNFPPILELYRAIA